MNALKDKKGVTLIELVVVIAIMGIILTAVSGLFIYIPGFFKKANDRSALQSEAIALMENIEVNLRTAVCVHIGGDTPPDANYAALVGQSMLDDYGLTAFYEYSPSEQGVIKVTLTGKKITGYTLTREIFLMNSKDKSSDIVTGSSSSDKIYIQKP